MSGLDWLLVQRTYVIPYRTIIPLKQALSTLIEEGHLTCEGTYNRGGPRGRDYVHTRTISTYRTANDGFAFQIVQYHHTSPHQLTVIGKLYLWQMFFEVNLRPFLLQFQDHAIVQEKAQVSCASTV